MIRSRAARTIRRPSRSGSRTCGAWQTRRSERRREAREERKAARWGRYEERGWIEARPTGSESRGYLVFGGGTVAEVRCLSGRYDLEGELVSKIRGVLAGRDVALKSAVELRAAQEARKKRRIDLIEAFRRRADQAR